MCGHLMHCVFLLPALNSFWLTGCCLRATPCQNMTQDHDIDPDHFSWTSTKRDITLKFWSSSNLEKGSTNSRRSLTWNNHQNDVSAEGHNMKTLVKVQKKIHFSLFCNMIREIKSR